MKKKTCYYAHCMAIYSTPQEHRDVALLKSLGFTVVNPNATVHIRKISRMSSSSLKMDYFLQLVTTCDVLAFRANPDGSISSGAAKEITTAGINNMSIIELPSGTLRRFLDIRQTVQYLEEAGQR